ncbi:hypothetical protein AOLI_G00230560 [Acnodon oligacanthus]
MLDLRQVPRLHTQREEKSVRPTALNPRGRIVFQSIDLIARRTVAGNAGESWRTVGRGAELKNIKAHSYRSSQCSSIAFCFTWSRPEEENKLRQVSAADTTMILWQIVSLTDFILSKSLQKPQDRLKCQTPPKAA